MKRPYIAAGILVVSSFLNILIKGINARFK